MPKFNPLFYRNFPNVSLFQEKWIISLPWTGRRGTYQALVECKSAGAEKKELAKIITGHSDDYLTLRGQNKCSLGEKINVSPLIAKFETKLREKIASLCKNDSLNANFQNTTVIVDGQEQAQLGVVEVSSKGESASINLYFGRKTYSQIDCLKAVSLIYAKGVLDSIGHKAFDAVGFTQNVPTDETLTKQPISNMLAGDRGWIRNFSDYIDKNPTGAWQAENVIKIDKDLYWGFGDPPPKSETGWTNKLREIYNSGLKKEAQRNEQVPGFDGDIIFVDVAQVIQIVFAYNIMEK